ncbi:MAG: OmpA family protein [Henriciella sp.]|nr:OmpA family protein [Henriciella sp.]
MRFGRRSISLTVVMLISAACGNAPDAAQPPASICVDIPNGSYFQVVDGRLIAITSTQLDARERPIETARRIGATLAGMGYPWVLLDWDGQVATVSGLALDENTRSDAFIATKSAFEADPVAGALVQRVVNNMSVRDPEGAIAVRLSDELSNEGYSWLRVEMSGRVATLIGAAPTRDMKELAYRAGRNLVESDLSAGEIVNIVVDAISIRGNGEPIGTPLIGLKPDPGLSECEAAYSALMAAQSVSFISGESVIENESARLLDAVTGITLLCDKFSLEIAGYVPADTAPDLAMDLSQRRASAVKDYLMAYGANAEQLTARGYGLPTPDGEEVLPRTDGAIEFIVRPETN